MRNFVVPPPSDKPLGRAGRTTRFAQGKTEVGGKAGSAVVRNWPEAPLRWRTMEPPPQPSGIVSDRPLKPTATARRPRTRLASLLPEAPDPGGTNATHEFRELCASILERHPNLTRVPNPVIRGFPEPQPGRSPRPDRLPRQIPDHHDRQWTTRAKRRCRRGGQSRAAIREPFVGDPRSHAAAGPIVHCPAAGGFVTTSRGSDRRRRPWRSLPSRATSPG
jgi:hypothetical protein